MTETERHIHNRRILAQLHPDFARAVRQVLEELQRASYRPVLQEGYVSGFRMWLRTLGGKGRASDALHSRLGPAGRPQACAVHILPQDFRPEQLHPRAGVVMLAHYLMMLEMCCDRHGLETGLTRGLRKSERDLIRAAVVKRNAAFPLRRVGIEPFHVEPQILPRDQEFHKDHHHHGGRRPA